MEEILLITIQNIQDRKAVSGIAPIHVLRSEIDKVVNDCLNSLYSQKKIEVGKTLNSNWIKIA